MNNQIENPRAKSAVKTLSNVFDLNTRNPYYQKDQDDQYFEYHTNSQEDYENASDYQDYENSSSQFYKEHSAADQGDLSDRRQRWIEAKFANRNEDECHLFMEKKFDIFFKDLSVNPESKTLDSKEKGVFESYESNCKFTREDLEQVSDSVSLDPFSVYTDKGSDGGQVKENAAVPEPDSNLTTESPYWKRIDVRQKKVIRGLSSLTKDYFSNLVTASKTKMDHLSIWNDFLEHHFPELYETSRLMLLGQISFKCLGSKFSENVKESSIFTDEEKQAIIKHGIELEHKKNNCSISKIRKEMLDTFIVKMGKLLYISSPVREEAFWSQINEKKKKEINELNVFKSAHMKDIEKIPVIDHIGTL